MTRSKKCKLTAIAMTIVAALLLTGCGAGSKEVDREQKEKQEVLLQESNRQTGMPNITNFQEKKLQKQIMELCDKSDLICYVYTFSEYTGKYNYVGKCVGYGLPYGTQYTNPQKSVYAGNNNYLALPQADPNGLFKPSDVNATWICMLDESGDKYIVYNETNITISGKKLPKHIVGSYPDNYDKE